MKSALPALLCLLFALSWAHSTAAQPVGEDDHEAVRAAIDQLFDGMRAGDSTMVRETFAPSMRLMTVTMRNGQMTVLNTPEDRFAQAVGTPHEEVWDERIWDVEIRVDGPLASAWVPYAFFMGDEFSHCGVNAFQLANLESGWKIIQITDTRRRACDLPDDVQAQ